VFVLTVFGAIWFILLQTMYGVHQVDAVARDVARAYQFRARDRVFRLVLPSAAPFIATGIRLAATVSLLLVIGGELIGGAPGIGSQITLRQQAAQIPAMYVYIVVAGVLGVVLNLIMLKIERRVLRWHHAQRSTAP
jgi:ABC-type nitrate/sulfonate/bicarbonate transport system permease component